jgi:enoyl-CoA hydratase/carnithine racemase
MVYPGRVGNNMRLATIVTQKLRADSRGVLDSQEKRNAITRAMLAEIGQAVAEAGRQPDVRAVLVRGNGKGFSAGIDLNAFADFERDFGPGWRGRMLEITENFQANLNAVAGCPAPTIALLHGFALGLGLELALACDLRLAAQGTQLGLPEARLGLIPHVGGTTRLTRLVGPARAKELIFTGGTVDEATAERWGLVNEVVPAEALSDSGLARTAVIAHCAPLAVRAAKQVIDQLGDEHAGLCLEAEAQNRLVQSEDYAEAMQAIAAKSTPSWQGR